MSGRRPLVLCIESELQESRHKAPLERYGYDVIAVTSDSEALAVLRKTPVDAAIVNLERPAINGGAVVRRLKNLKSHVPVLLLVSPSMKIAAGAFPAADAIMLTTDAPSRVVGVLDNLLNVKFPFFARWFGNWKHRIGA